MRVKKSLYLFFYVIALCCHPAYAGPWLTPSEAWTSSANLATKSDVTLLADYGLIKAPILIWPIAWDNIGPALESEASQEQIKKCPFYIQQAYFRILAQYRLATRTHLQPKAYLSGGHDINPFRTFDYQPRSDFQGGASLEKQGTHWAAKLASDFGRYDDVTSDAHFDDSYLYLFLGNWGIGVDKMNRWWGPGYSSSMVWSANPPPLANVSIQRMQALPFESKWLRWIGPWSLTSSLSIGGPEVPEPHPLIWLLNLSTRPVESVQLSLSRSSLFAGDKRPLNWRMLGNLLTADDNCDPNIYGAEYCQKYTPGNELWELTVDWNWYKTWRVPADLYLQTSFNDRIPSDSYRWVYDRWHSLFPKNNPPIPARTAFLAGISSWFPIKNQLLRLYAEFEYTHQYAYFFWGEQAKDIFGGNYPYVYYGKLISSTLGSDATGYTLGAIFNEDSGNSDSFMARYLQLNAYDFRTNYSTPFAKQDLLWLSINRTYTLARDLGRLSGQLGYLQSLRGQGLKSSPSAYLVWTKNF